MLVIGCGGVGRRVAQGYAARGEGVWGVVRGAGSARALAALGVRPVVLDLDRPEPLALPAAGGQVFYFAPPPERGAADPRMARVLDALRTQGAPLRLVYISTTGVYGDCGGAWVDETRAVRPVAERALRRWDAERQLRAWSGDTGAEVVILRVAGIYGPDRLPLERIRQGLPVVRAEEAPFTNRIHEDDLVAVCVAAMEQPVAGEVFNVSDGHPGTMAEYFDAVADLAGLPRPPKIAMGEAAGRLSPGMLSYVQESRRLRNDKLLARLGVVLRYPDLERGLSACAAALRRPE
jgi:nucleoside-diphosphate-sugar epimerase